MAIKQLKHPGDKFDLRLDESKPFDVVGFGMNAVDHLCVVPRYPRYDTKTEILRYELLPGGQVATAVVCLARMGWRTRYVGKVGSDSLGQIQLDSLQAEAIDTSAVRVEPDTRNQYAFIITDHATGERTILWQRDRRLNFREGELRKEDVCAGRILHIDTHDGGVVQKAAAWAQEEGIPVVIDADKVVPGCEELISKVDFLLVSANFPRDLTHIEDLNEGLLAMRRYCPGFLAVTLGADGVLAVIGDECVHFPAFNVRAVDTTGAGDVFRGAFIHGLLSNWTLEMVMRFAQATAGLSCTRLGARSGIPTVAEALRLAETPVEGSIRDN